MKYLEFWIVFIMDDPIQWNLTKVDFTSALLAFFVKERHKVTVAL